MAGSVCRSPFCVPGGFSVYTAAVSRVPPHATGSAPGPGGTDHVEELGDDAIIAEEMGAHAPKPRARVMEESRSIVISEPARAPLPNVLTDAGPRKRSERSEKTVVIRERRQIDDLRREIEKRKKSASQPPRSRGLLLWVIVGVGAFLIGGLAALFAGRDQARQMVPVAESASGAALVPPAPAPAESAEPPSISIDALPIEGEKK